MAGGKEEINIGRSPIKTLKKEPGGRRMRPRNEAAAIGLATVFLIAINFAVGYEIGGHVTDFKRNRNMSPYFAAVYELAGRASDFKRYRNIPPSFGNVSPHFEDVRKTESIAPGIERIEIKRGDFSDAAGSDRWTINVLVLDPKQVRLGLGLALDEIVGAETTSSIAARHGAAAAVNGGYFRTTGLLKGEPAGLLMMAGKILSEPAKGRAALAVSNTGGRIRIASVLTVLKAVLQVEDGPSCPIDGFNRDRAVNDLIVLTPEFHRTTLTDPSGLEAVVRAGRVVEIRDHQGSTPIPADGFVISARGAGRDWMRLSLAAGARVTIATEIEARPRFPFKPDFILGGGPRLLAEGRPVPSEAEAYPEGFYAARHPRTAAGVRADGTVVLAVIDGRRPQLGVGMSISELSALMAELGCVEAVNLDGGGSATMVVKGRVVNSPSDAAGERPVSDALLVFSRR
jgi:exopolysaccharide biosynthesis protein